VDVRYLDELRDLVQRGDALANKLQHVKEVADQVATVSGLEVLFDVPSIKYSATNSATDGRVTRWVSLCRQDLYADLLPKLRQAIIDILNAEAQRLESQLGDLKLPRIDETEGSEEVQSVE
jgi:hypothetical protein